LWRRVLPKKISRKKRWKRRRMRRWP